MAFCGQCGFENPDGAQFCGNCGADLTQQGIGNVESIVNESTGTTSKESDPMAYVPLDTPPTEEPTIFPKTETCTPEPTSYTPEPPVTPTPPPASYTPEPPVAPTPPPPPPAPQVQAPTPPPAAPAATQVVIQAAPPTTPQTPRPIPPKSGGGGGKTCLGCGCAAAIVLLLLLGGLGWWGYDYYKKHNKSLDEVLEWIDKGHAEWEEQHGTGNENPDTQMYEGKTLRQLAEENGFPCVTYNERPSEACIYRNEEAGLNIRFNYLKFKEGDYIGAMTLTGLDDGQVLVFRFSPCGCSIFKLNYPNDTTMKGYVFVYKGARRILLGSDDQLMEFVQPDDDDDEEEEE